MCCRLPSPEATPGTPAVPLGWRFFDHVVPVPAVWETGVDLDGIRFASLAWLRKLKQATGRTKDLLDLEQLPSDGDDPLAITSVHPHSLGSRHGLLEADNRGRERISPVPDSAVVGSAIVRSVFCMHVVVGFTA